VISSSCGLVAPFLVWPNPVINTAWINVSSTINAEADIRLYDARGIMVMLKETNLPTGNSQLSLNLGSLAQGGPIY
jgi:hypothetical protein